MKERPILMNAEMVRAVLNDSKTQTRRALKPKGWDHLKLRAYEFVHVLWGKAASVLSCPQPAETAYAGFTFGSPSPVYFNCPFGQVGDRLWVREAWQLHGRATDVATVVYKASRQNSWTEMHQLVPADVTLGTSVKPFQEGWRPSIHMPRWACRLVLEIVSVRVERLQDISEADAKAEGAKMEFFPWERLMMDKTICHRGGFHRIWSDVYGEDDWHANPWVWVVEFKKVTK